MAPNYGPFDAFIRSLRKERSTRDRQSRSVNIPDARRKRYQRRVGQIDQVMPGLVGLNEYMKRKNRESKTTGKRKRTGH